MLTKRMGYLLAVEDSEEDFDTITDAARRACLPNEIRRVTSGEECLLYLEDRARNRLTLPILILLDLNTPKGDGREALRAMIGCVGYRLSSSVPRAMPVMLAFATSTEPMRIT